MKLDAKQQVLIAIYLEYQKDLPGFDDNLTPEALGMGERTFHAAIVKLHGEELIRGAEIEWIMESGRVKSMFGMLMTRSGIEYIERKFQIDMDENGLEKAKIISKKIDKFGNEQLHSYAEKVIGEM